MPDECDLEKAQRNLNKPFCNLCKRAFFFLEAGCMYLKREEVGIETAFR